jgi:hypothetical protein
LVRASPQLSLFPVESTSDADVWVARFSRYFDDPERHCGFLELAEAAVAACPGDPSILTLAATAAVLDQRPARALAFLKRISKRYSATPTDHLLRALALFQEGKRLVAQGLLVRHDLIEWPAALQAFPGGMERVRWLAKQLDAIMDRARLLPRKQPRPALKSNDKRLLASRPERPSGRMKAPATRPAEIETTALQSLPRIEVDISFAAEVELLPMLQAVARVPEREGRWWELRERFTHLSFAQGFDELLCLPHLTGVEPLWHQIETVRKVLKQFRGRVLLADEVGLGKTIEAGMVLKEYALRGMAERVLVLSPASLVGQWREELETKFSLPFATTTTRCCAPILVNSGGRSVSSRRFRRPDDKSMRSICLGASSTWSSSMKPIIFATGRARAGSSSMHSTSVSCCCSRQHRCRTILSNCTTS